MLIIVLHVVYTHYCITIDIIIIIYNNYMCIVHIIILCIHDCTPIQYTIYNTLYINNDTIIGCDCVDTRRA